MEYSFKYQWFGGNKEQMTRHPWISGRILPFFVIVVPLAGEYHVQNDLDKTTHTIHPGEALVVPPNQPHSIACMDHCLLNYAHLYFRVQDWQDPFFGRSIPLLHRGETAQELRTLTEALFDERNTLENSLIPAGRIFTLLYQNSFPAQTFSTPSYQMERIEKVILFIKKNLHKKLTRKDLSEIAGLSETRFHYVFKEMVGKAPLEYMIDCRIQKAKELLIITDQNIAAIAGDCGWHDPIFFTRQFRQKEGISPRQFRQQQRLKMHLPVHIG